MVLTDKVVIITGASGGIGQAIAHTLSEAGAKLVLTGRREEKLTALQADLTTESIIVIGDLTETATAENIAKSSINAFGRVDVLVNNAGYAPPASLLETDEALWDVTIDSCLKTAYQMTRAILPEMLEQGTGRVVMISSVAGKHGFASRSAYCAAKWGMQGFTEALRDEVGEQGIRLHTIHPAAVATEWWGTTNDAQSEEVLAKMVQPQDVADAVRYVLTQPDNVQINEVVVNTFKSPWA